ncbi:MAG: ABC transporter permease, partial [Balneolales bacterium]|nr:ABC transporter permease [Balneolales bacterium]
FWFACLAFSFVVSLFAGSYPAFFLSSFNPIEAIKGKLRQGRKSVRFRQVLVVFQFTISIFLIIGTITIHEQINHAKNRSMGYEKEGLITIEGRNSEFAQKAEVLREELIRTGAVEEVAFSNYPLTNTLGNNSGFSVEGSSTIFQETFNTIYVTPEYGAATQWELVAGREFSRDLGSEMNSIILSESAVEQMGLTDPIGKEIIAHDNTFNGQTNFTVVGVVKDMIKGSPFGRPVPLMLFSNTSTNRRGYMFVRLNPDLSYGESIAAIQKSFHSVLPNHPFHAHFADDQYLAKFRSEDQTGTLATIFSALAILISCLGLFGLSAFMVTQRVKEIGIRKVLGASITSLWALLSKDFGILVAIACLISVPIGGYVMNIWLQDHAYRISLGWEIYTISIVLSIVVTLATVSYHSVKASLANPVISLKSE